MLETKKAFYFSLLMLAGIGAIGLFLLIFVVLADEVIEKEIEIFDQVILSLIQFMQNPFLDGAMKLTTELGSLWFIAIIFLLIISFLWFQYKDGWTIFFLFWAVGGGGLLNLLLKSLFERNRPSQHAIVDSEGFSFSSGHAMASLTFYGFLIYLLIRNPQKKTVYWVSITFIAILIAAIGFSRIYLGIHYPSDVLSGYLVVAAWLIFSLMALEWKWWKSDNENVSVRFLLKSIKIMVGIFYTQILMEYASIIYGKLIPYYKNANGKYKRISKITFSAIIDRRN